MLVPSFEGVVAFHPDSMMPAAEPPVVQVTAVNVFNEPVPITPDGTGPLTVAPLLVEQLKFTHDQSFFQIRWRALDFRDPDRTRYAYRMPELDERWIDTGTRGRGSVLQPDPRPLHPRARRGGPGRGVESRRRLRRHPGDSPVVGLVVVQGHRPGQHHRRPVLGVARSQRVPPPQLAVADGPQEDSRALKIAHAKKMVIYLGTVGVLMQVFSAAHETLSATLTDTLRFPGLVSGILASMLTAFLGAPVRNSLKRWVGLE